MQVLTPEVKKLVECLLTDLGSVRALSILIMVRHEQWDELSGIASPDPTNYDCGRSFAIDACATAILRKFEVNHGEIARKAEETALASWKNSEIQNFHTNRQLYPLVDDVGLKGPHVARVIRRAQSFIQQTLRSYTQPEGRFGPGATVSDRSSFVTIPNKLSTVPTVTSDALGYLVPWIGTGWARCAANRNNVPIFACGNKLFFVPKNMRTKRACSTEPSINAYYQLGIGSLLRSRILTSLGVDLRHAQEVHHALARSGSIDQSWATLDLSQASDTMSASLVELLLPSEWFSALNDLRAKKTLVEGKWQKLEKFSSMGNGFTFELESLVFMAICVGVCPELIPGKTLYVYGDDIIVPTENVEDIVAALSYFGFKLNTEKSYSDTWFRESCGGDFFRGHPCRGYYLKAAPSIPADWFVILNQLRRVGSITGKFPSRAYRYALNQIPAALRLRGPVEGLGDAVIHSDDPGTWKVKVVDGIRYVAGLVHHTVPTFTVGRFEDEIVMQAVLYGSYPGEWPEIKGHNYEASQVTRHKFISLYAKRGWVNRGAPGSYTRKWLAYS